MGTSSLDPDAVRSVAGRLDGAAATLLGVADARLTGWRFGGPSAGRAHGAAGAELAAHAERLAADLTGWAYAAGEIAAALRSGADGHLAAESDAAAALR